MTQFVRQFAKALFRRTFGHRREQRAHHLRMPTKAGQPHGSGRLTHKQVDDQQTPDRGAFETSDPVLCMQAQAMALQQPDDSQWQQQNQLQGAGLKETIAHGGEDFLQREMGSEPGGDSGGGDHQQGIEAQDKANHDDEYADQRP